MLLNQLTRNRGRLSDFFRFIVLYLFGGAYSDMDCYPYKGLREWDHYPFENTGILFSMEGIFAEQYMMFTQPMHPILGQFLTVFMDTFIHDKQMLHAGYNIEYGGPGTWLYAIYSLCDMNPMDKDSYVDEFYANGRSSNGWQPHLHPNWVFENYKNRNSKFR
jgi:hypothetical protein